MPIRLAGATAIPQRFRKHRERWPARIPTVGNIPIGCVRACEVLRGKAGKRSLIRDAHQSAVEQTLRKVLLARYRPCRSRGLDEEPRARIGKH